MKKWLLGAVVAAFVIGGGLFWGYRHYFHRDVTENDVHVEEGFFDFTDIVNETETEEGLSPTRENGFNVTSPSAGETAHPNPIQAPSGQGQSEPAQGGRSQGNAAVSVETIRNKYYPKFKRLESAALARLDQLARNALADYRQSQKTGQPSLSDLASLYISAANKLEDGVNHAFYQLLGQMEAELKEAGLPTDLVEEAETTYKNAVEQKKNELLGYALKVKNGGN